MHGIYLIKNKINGKIYIGSAVNITSRWTIHRVSLNRNDHHNILLQRAWNKYGIEAFEFSVLECCEIENLLEYEQKWINKLKPYDKNVGYNLCSVAGSQLGLKRTQETKIKISRKGSKHSEETKRAMSFSRKGRKKSKEHKIKIGLVHKGKIVSDQSRMKMSISHKRKNAFRLTSVPIVIGEVNGS